MVAHPKRNLAGLTLERPLSVRLFKEPGSVPLAAVPVQPVDFAEVAGETWRDEYLRRGHPDVPLTSISIQIAPVLAADSESRCSGFKLTHAMPCRERSSSLFSLSSLRHVAERAVGALLETGGLQPNERHHYDIVTQPVNSPQPHEQGPGETLTTPLRFRALSFVSTKLRPLIEQSTPVALLDSEVFPVFYTQDAFLAAEASSRRGAAAERETGGALFGSLATCPETGEFFAIVRDVIEVEDAEGTQFSLSYSGGTWQRLRQIQEARQKAFPARADRLLGQAHGHPFRPNDGQQCATCEKLATCRLTSAFASSEDRTWHRAVFARQPWALCHIFGWSVRGEPVHQLYGLSDGQLHPRGFYLLPNNLLLP